jgi:hypothetical protein
MSLILSCTPDPKGAHRLHITALTKDQHLFNFHIMKYKMYITKTCAHQVRHILFMTFFNTINICPPICLRLVSTQQYRMASP